MPGAGHQPVGVSRLGDPTTVGARGGGCPVDRPNPGLHALRREVYGFPRIWEDLVVDDGERIGRKRVERLMRQAGISGLITKKWKNTTVRVPGVRVAEDLLDRDFAAAAPNRCWVADITYLRAWEGWLDRVAVQDLYSRRIVGWSMANHMRTELVRIGWDSLGSAAIRVSLRGLWPT